MREPESYHISYLTGVTVLKPAIYRATWKSHDLFDMSGGYLRYIDCDLTVLGIAASLGMQIEFTNRQPAPPLSWWQRLGRALKP